MPSSPRATAQRVSMQASFVLHHRAFRDTSVIANLLTPDFGRVDVVARGVRSAKSRRRALLQPFRPLLASWTGRSDLSTLTTLEESGVALSLEGEALGCAYYVTELALRLVPRQEPAVELFALYAETLTRLTATTVSDEKSADPAREREILMRVYETGLLRALGLMPNLAHCDATGNQIEPSVAYQFDPVNGVASSSGSVAVNHVVVHGGTLLAMANDTYQDTQVLSEAKRLMRALLREHLGDAPLNSRAVFKQFKSRRDPDSNDRNNTQES